MAGLASSAVISISNEGIEASNEGIGARSGISIQVEDGCTGK